MAFSALPRALCLTIALALPSLDAQSLARPNWMGSGLSLESWTAHAVLYALDPRTFGPRLGTAPANLQGVTSQLDYLRSLGVDAIVLTHLQPAGSLQTLDPALGSLDDFDELLREAARTNLRVLIELAPEPAISAAALNTAARFWLARGAAGVSLPVELPSATAHSLHLTVAGTPGHRIVVAPPGPEGVQNTDLTLTTPLNPSGTATALRLSIAAVQSGFLLNRLGPGNLQAANGNPEAAKLLATLLLASGANAELDAGQELDLNVTLPNEEADPASLLNYTRRLIDLHHGSAALRTGTNTLLNRDADQALVWINRRAQVNAQTPAVVFACNLSSAPIKLSLTEDLARLQLRGTFLRPVLRSGPGMGGQSVNAITLPPFGVYVGELRF